MTDEINRYLAEVDKIYRAGNATEHSCRPALKTLFESLFAPLAGAVPGGLAITNEPKHIACGAPDYIITQNDIPLGYIEAKDISAGLYNKANKGQFDRYKQSLANLIITDYLSFQLFADGTEVVTVTIAKESGGGISADKKQYAAFVELVQQFLGFRGKSIYQSEQLAKMMAAKAKLLAGIIEKALNDKDADNEAGEVGADTLPGQLEGFRKILIHGLSIPSFAGIYAQTLAYGMFAAALNASGGVRFSRQSAAGLIPRSNPFLRKFFQYIAGFDLDSRICWIVDAMADMFNYVAVDEILKEFGRAGNDPYIHFYETFLAEYDPKLRGSRGVYYTPLPAVKFIVQAVDDVLQKEFRLSKGLADNTKIKRSITRPDGTKKDAAFHKVQILDPAVGTGTFLAEVVGNIYKRFSRQKGMWANYCAEHLVPRLNGFEILMTPYAMAHIKLDMLLKESGGGAGSRLHIFLTNTLEEAPESVPALFMAEWLAEEAREAAKVKRDAPVMVVMGNPPYNVSSQNKNPWIDALLADYKREPETGCKLREQKLNLDDDYVKFIRFGQTLVEKNGGGILAYINNHGFLDNPTFRGMRWNLLQAFDKIYILDLHGNAKKKEAAPDGGKDENVFDIQQGASVNIFIKTGEGKGSLARLFHAEIYGRRQAKYQYLVENTMDTVEWKELKPSAPYYFFVPKNFENRGLYEEGFSVKELFPLYNAGIKTDRDSLFIDMDREALESRMKTLFSGEITPDFRERYNVKDSGSYRLTSAMRNKTFSKDNIKTIMYRPFDFRYIYYEAGLTSRPAHRVMQHFLHNENVGLITARQFGGKKQFICFITKSLIEISSQPFAPYTLFPLYLYPAPGELDRAAHRRPNLNMAVVKKIAQKTGLNFTAEKSAGDNTFAPVDLLDYIYAFLHSNNYRLKYKEFLKIDFPRAPYPENRETFQTLSKYGASLRTLHLFKNVEPIRDIAAYPKEGDNRVEKVNYNNGKVWINKRQYFENVPLKAWDYYIGGYQPAQKWLKDRKERILRYDDIAHYQKIIAVLKLTIEIQHHIDEIIQ